MTETLLDGRTDTSRPHGSQRIPETRSSQLRLQLRPVTNQVAKKWIMTKPVKAKTKKRRLAVPCGRLAEDCVTSPRLIVSFWEAFRFLTSRVRLRSPVTFCKLILAFPFTACHGNVMTR
jgi:hypothetical protein